MPSAWRWPKLGSPRASTVPGTPLIDHHTYGICGDGDLMEGISQEAASLAGHLRLGKLIFLYDQNHISLAGATSLCFTEDVGKRFEAYGWHTRHVHEGNDTEDIAKAIEEARAETRKPSLDSGPHAHRLWQPEEAGFV